jgi:hypothetical protein
MLNKGDMKEFPTACVGVANYLKSEDGLLLPAEIKRECETDGMEVIRVAIDSNGKLDLNARYDY